MKLLDKVKPIGELSIYLDYHKGKGKELFYQENNLVVKAAKQVILTSLYQDSVTSDPIRILKIGTGGVIDPSGLFPKLEDPLQEDLSAPILSLDAVYIVDFDNVAIKFLADIDTDQANGNVISEAGLFKNSGAIFNVKNHPGIPKTPEFSIHYEWNIRIV